MGEMKQATRDALKVHLTKLKAGDLAAHQDEAPATYCALPSIFVSPHHLQPATLPIQIYLPSLQPLELLSHYPAPHHCPCQHPYPRKHLPRSRRCLVSSVNMLQQLLHWRIFRSNQQTRLFACTLYNADSVTRQNWGRILAKYILLSILAFFYILTLFLEFAIGLLLN